MIELENGNNFVCDTLPELLGGISYISNLLVRNDQELLQVKPKRDMLVALAALTSQTRFSAQAIGAAQTRIGAAQANGAAQTIGGAQANGAAHPVSAVSAVSAVGAVSSGLRRTRKLKLSFIITLLLNIHRQTINLLGL
jgi:hypothetical protein